MSLAFAIVFAAAWAIALKMGLDAVVTPIVMSVVLVSLQYLVSPRIVGWTMKVQWVSIDDEPELHGMVAELAEAARIPMPRVGVSSIEVPNAFAYGRWLGDSRVVVTRALLDILAPDQLRAVLGHEIVHIKNSDPSRAERELESLAEVDEDCSGTIDARELARLRDSGVRRSAGDAIIELVSTHPNMSKRLERLSRLEG